MRLTLALTFLLSVFSSAYSQTPENPWSFDVGVNSVTIKDEDGSKLSKRHGSLGIEYYIDNSVDREDQRGIGGGIDYCVSKVKTEFVNILHSDFWVAPNQDIELLKLYDDKYI